MEIELIEVADLHLDPANVRRHDGKNLDAIAASLARFGQQKPIVVSPAGVVLAGNGTLNAAKRLGWSSIRAVTTSLENAEATAYAIADNRTAELAEWDDDALAQQLSALQIEDAALLEAVGFTDEELTALVNDSVGLEPEPPEEVAPVETADDEIPEAPPAITQPGEVVHLGRHTLIAGDCIELMKAQAENSIDAVVTDPPYGIGFMGKGWDCAVPGEAFAREALRVLKPGGHLIAFAATRTVHRLTVALEDAGFEVRDQIGWLQWQGFPKSLDVSKAIDKGDPITPDAQRWAGWGTALKPAQEPAILCRKPLEGTVAENVLKWGTGAINIDGCRIGYGDSAWPGPGAVFIGSGDKFGGFDSAGSDVAATGHALGRWPANIYHTPKPSRGEREAGCDGLQARSREDVTGRKAGSAGQQHARSGMTRTGEIGNHHPTVKPVALMRWLVRLVTPPGGKVLEPFAGSGTTLIAAEREAFDCLAFEREPAYCDIIRARAEGALEGGD